MLGLRWGFGKKKKEMKRTVTCVAISTGWRHPDIPVLSRVLKVMGPVLCSCWSRYKIRCPNKHWEPKYSIGFGSQQLQKTYFLQNQFPAFFWYRTSQVYTLPCKSVWEAQRSTSVEHQHQTSVTSPLIKGLGERERYLFCISSLMPF